MSVDSTASRPRYLICRCSEATALLSLASMIMRVPLGQGMTWNDSMADIGELRTDFAPYPTRRDAHLRPDVKRRACGQGKFVAPLGSRVRGGAVGGPAAIQPEYRSGRLKWCVALAVMFMLHPICVPASEAAAKLTCAMTCRKNLAACRKVQCAALRGKDRRECLDRCERSIECPTGAAPRPTGGAPLGTLAYVVTECRTLNGQLSGGQKLVVRHGDCDPRTIMEFTYPEPVSDPFGVCEPFGSSRAGYVALAAGPFQRIGVSPDGSLVVFEVTNGFSSLRQAGVEPIPLPPDAEGTYSVRADGTDLHRLGPPCRQSSSPRLTTLVQRIFYSRCFPLAAEDTFGKVRN